MANQFQYSTDVFSLENPSTQKRSSPQFLTVGYI